MGWAREGAGRPVHEGYPGTLWSATIIFFSGTEIEPNASRRGAMVFLSKLGKSLVRNLPEITAFATGQMPDFMYGKRKFRDVPVFCFHAVLADQFERQLRFLRDNGYIGLNSTELETRLSDPGYRNDGKEIVLTFDDGLISLWTVAFPLLQKYGVKVISFVLPGMTDTLPSLCSWQQIQGMHQSGLVDFQSHGMIHPMVAVGPEIVDFVHPGYESDYYGIPQLPFYGDGSTQGDRRIPVLGHPVYRHASRYAGKPRYFDDIRLREACAEFVRQQGPGLFHRKDWRHRLTGVVGEFKARHPLIERFESPAERDQALRYELVESRRQLELNLDGKPIRHFCNPWYVGSALMARMAFEAGYSSLHLGASVGFAHRAAPPGLRLIRRLQGEYLMALPGNGRTGLRGVFSEKLLASRRRDRMVAAGPASE
jgi:hypothetical protein